MSYVPHTAAEQQEMLTSIGANSIEDLLTSIPQAARFQGLLNLPPALTEMEVRRLVSDLANKNVNLDQAPSFLGAGSYDHFIPSVVPHLGRRSEFYTSYTPYQAEVSQGMLQAIYEFQTMICQLTGMDVANASLYDGATAVAEAALLAVGATNRSAVVVSTGVDPQYRAVLRTYAFSRGFTLHEVAATNGVTAPAAIAGAVNDNTALVVVQQPNFFGCIEDMAAIEQAAHARQALFCVAITEPISLGLLQPPGKYNADIVAAEGQSLGNAPLYGGPALGLFATKENLTRRLPGRLVGKTTDDRGQVGYVLTLQTREQHIRRERATSNICTNQTLLAVFATIYLAALGNPGVREVAELCLQKAHYAQEQICRLPGYRLAYEQPFFHEFAVSTPVPTALLAERFKAAGIIGGYPLNKDYPELGEALLFCVTELRTKGEIDRLVEILATART